MLLTLKLNIDYISYNVNVYTIDNSFKFENIRLGSPFHIFLQNVI